MIAEYIILNRTSEWHDSQWITGGLSEYLNMTLEEYAAYVERNAIPKYYFWRHLKWMITNLRNSKK